MQIRTLISEVEQRIATAMRPFVVAVDGHSAAGKSTVSQAIVAALPQAALLCTDDFYRVMDAQERFALSAIAGYHAYYDWQRMRREALHPLKLGEAAQFKVYDWQRNQLGEWRRIAPAPAIVVEGCFSARPEFDAFVDFVVFVEADPDTRRKRQSERADASPTWLARWEAAEEYYISTTQLRHRADVVVIGQ